MYHLHFMHWIAMLMFIFCPFWILATSAERAVVPKTRWEVDFSPDMLAKVPMNTMELVNLTTNDLTLNEIQYGVVRITDDSSGHILPMNYTFTLSKETIENNNWSTSFNVTANFLGYTSVYVGLYNKSDNTLLKEADALSVTIVREERVIDKVFTYSIAIFVSLACINFGCALDWLVLKKTLRRPVGPIIGLTSQFLFMPLISYGIGQVIFPHSIPMQLGMFFTGVSPAGGTSNIWTYTLGGNLNLSIAMTTLSITAAFAMMPLWIFTLGSSIFSKGKLTIPYSRIAEMACGLVIPLGIGFLIQIYLPRVSKFMVRVIKLFSVFLIGFVIFAIITNLYLFKLFTWEILVAGLGLPWLGFLCGMILARICKQPPGDILAIAIETGIQNTGIAIFMLRFSLGQPEADLTTVIPVAVAVMTPFPLLILLLVNKLRACRENAQTQKLIQNDAQDINRQELFNLDNSENNANKY